MTDERLKKHAGDSRTNRAAEDRKATENREVTEQERLEMFRQQLFQSALPDLPKIPGYHTCWLTTMNPRDSIQGRLRLGYEPVKPEDVPGWEYATLKTGEWVGFIGVNEMLAFKLPQSLYEKFMHEAHYAAPLREEEKLQETADAIAEQAARKGSKVSRGDGLLDIVDDREAQFEL
jgi:hypothetical protein